MIKGLPGYRYTVNSIKILSEEVVDLIAAGEVIDSVAAVVRELVENAIDAKATRISVSLWPQQWRIEVADNGEGMNLANLKLAAMAHSTSKIATARDLLKISSLGFRGEALHSIAQLSDLEILSRPGFSSSPSSGWRVVYNHQGETEMVEAVAIAPGTVVRVSNLFANWSSRRTAGPTATQQLRGAQLLLQQIALCHPQVTWQIHQNDRPWLRFGPAMTTQQMLPEFIRGIRAGDLQYLKMDVDPPESVEECHENLSKSWLEVVIGLPDRASRGRKDWVKIGVNGRMVRSPELEPTILSAFARTCGRDRYPICFVHLHIDPALIDWNRHPSKAEIYLHYLKHWQDQIHLAIAQTLKLNPESLSAGVNPIEKLLRVSEDTASYRTRPTPLESAENPQRIDVPKLKAIGQIHNTYIVAEHPEGLWLVEQHIAHERVIYEQLCRRWQVIPLSTPIILANLSEAQLEQLTRLNLEVDPFGEGLWAVRSAPEILCDRPDCQEALIELSHGGDLQAAQVATACRSAIRNGTPLSLTEMQTLLDQWVTTRSPRTCPHGRPIFLSLEESSLARFFRRSWVIGKSHGL